MKNLIITLLLKLGIYKHVGPISVEDAIIIVKAAPKDKWTTGVIHNQGQSCFLGHLKRAKKVKGTLSTGSLLQISPEIEEIDLKITHFVNKKHNLAICHSFTINDSDEVNGYNEEHPKDRMLHVLNDMKKAGIK